MNDDTISREALRRRMYHEAFEMDNGMQRWDSGLWIRYKIFENAIEEAPAVEPERKRGKWRDGHRSSWDGTRHWYRYCDVCGYERDDDDPVHDSYFCPNCGAQMDERR